MVSATGLLILVYVALTVLAALDYHEDGMEHADCPLCQLSASLHSVQPSPLTTVEAIPAVEALETAPPPPVSGVVSLVRTSARSPPTSICEV